MVELRFSVTEQTLNFMLIINIAIDSSYAALRMKGLVKCEEAIFSF